MLEKLKEIIKEHTGSDIDITEDTVLLTDLGMSSFDLVQLVCAVEDEFDIEIPDKEIKNFKTVGDVIGFIERQ